MKNSKKHNKLGVKLLASVLSVITFLPGSAPCAGATNAKEVGSGNSVVRKIKDVGSRANESAKGVWIKISTWIKNHPKTTIAIGTVVVLAIVGTTVGFVCYKSNKGKKEKERLEAAKKAAEEAAKEEATRKAAEKPEKAEEKKEEEPVAEAAEEKAAKKTAREAAREAANEGLNCCIRLLEDTDATEVFEGRRIVKSSEEVDVLINDFNNTMKTLVVGEEGAQLLLEGLEEGSERYEKRLGGLRMLQKNLTILLY